MEELEVIDSSKFKVSNVVDELEEGEITVDRSELAKMLVVSVYDLTFDFENDIAKESINED